MPDLAVLDEGRFSVHGNLPLARLNRELDVDFYDTDVVTLTGDRRPFPGPEASGGFAGSQTPRRESGKRSVVAARAA